MSNVGDIKSQTSQSGKCKRTRRETHSDHIQEDRRNRKREDPLGGLRASSWANETNEGVMPKVIPLHSQYSAYSKRGKVIKRWTKGLHNRPIGDGIGYIMENLKARRGGKTVDKHPSDHVRGELKGEITENGK